MRRGWDGRVRQRFNRRGYTYSSFILLYSRNQYNIINYYTQLLLKNKMENLQYLGNKGDKTEIDWEK